MCSSCGQEEILGGSPLCVVCVVGGRGGGRGSSEGCMFDKERRRKITRGRKEGKKEEYATSIITHHNTCRVAIGTLLHTCIQLHHLTKTFS